MIPSTSAGGTRQIGTPPRPRRASDRLVRHLLAPVDASSLVAYRVALGLLLFAGVVRFAAYGWIHDLYIAPQTYFPYAGFEWVTPWPAWGMYAHFAALGVLALLIAAGVWFRAACAAFAVLFTYVELLDQTHYLNHYYLVTIVVTLMAFMPLGRGATSAPRWCLWALRAQVGLVYFFAGVAKLGSDWLLHAQPLSIWLAASTDAPLVGPLLGERWVAFAASWFGAVFDLSVVFFLLARRTRAAAFAVVVAFHVATFELFHLGIFPWLMIANATLFFDPDWPRRLAFRPPRHAPAARARTPRALQRAGLAVLAAHVALQVAMPFRHYLYPGDVLWNEQGMRLSWKVMVVEKAGMARFHVTDPATGRSWIVYPGDHLTRRQEKMMATSPDMILALAHHVARDFRDRGIPGVEVRADVFVSLNGRRSARLVDPRVDLAAEPAHLIGAHEWILPAPE